MGNVRDIQGKTQLYCVRARVVFHICLMVSVWSSPPKSIRLGSYTSSILITPFGPTLSNLCTAIRIAGNNHPRLTYSLLKKLLWNSRKAWGV